jgi:glycosyltransferase involved in cell wall biosynthesis
MSRRYRQAYVIGAHLPNGGTYMAYHIGRILQRDFGIHAIAVRMADESADHGIQIYDPPLPQVSLAEMERTISADDILVVNPSFSPHQFGWRLPGFKLSYVQDFKTFALLDRGIDHYVAVSDFVRDFLRTVYGLDVSVIPPFIQLERMPVAPAWTQRPANLVFVYRKGMPEVWELSWQRLHEIVTARAPHVRFTEPVAASGIAQQDLFAQIAAARYFLALSAAEGFGLVPLEAMALGAAVVGYDGFGGRHYMRAGENCEVAAYPHIERVAELLIAAVANPERSEQIAQRGHQTAAQYSYAEFRRAWIEELRRALHIEPLST